MKNIQKILVCAFAIVVAVQFASCGSNNSDTEILTASADYPYYESLSDLASASDIIVYGEVISKSNDSRNTLIVEEGENYPLEQLNDAEPITINIIKVIEEYTGRLDSNEISLLQFGDEEIVYEDSPVLEEKNCYVLFLSSSKKWDDSFWLLNDMQAVYKVDKEKRVIERNEFELSFEWLERYSVKE